MRKTKRGSRGGRPKGSFRAVAPHGQDIGPTRELLAKRARLCGARPTTGGMSTRPGRANVDDPRAGYPLGVLRVRELITEAEDDVGLWYGWLHRRRFGLPLANAAPFYERMVAPLPSSWARSTIPDDEQERLERLYRWVDDALLDESGALAKRAVQEVAIFHEFPSYLDQWQDDWTPPRPFHDLKAGLRGLCKIRNRPMPCVVGETTTVLQSTK